VHFYRISGLSVGSDIALPGMIGWPGSHGAPDVAIRRAPVPQALEGASHVGPIWQIAGNRFLLCIPNIVRFLLTGGREIAFEPEPGADESDIPIFIVGSAFGILLHQREQVVLHASAVRVNGKAVLFCGASGAGKSTLAAALAQRGYPLITDDVCAVTVNTDGTPTVQSDGRQLKLWAQAIERLDLAERRGARVRNRLDKYYIETAESCADPLPLGAVYALREARPPHAPGIERPNVVDAALILRRNAYRPLVVRRLNQKINYFQAAGAIANRAGIFHLTREIRFDRMADVLAMLESHWREAGLMEQAA
jgi:hypothetical protein